jgi:N6-adenosine-specific RNA methylase IME4
MTLKFHPFADVFPLLEGKELLDLAEDIKTNGLHHPILLADDGSIADGRNRYRACELVGVEPTFEKWNGEGSLLDLIISLNLKRRHLSIGQRAMAAAKAEPLYAEEARKRQLAAQNNEAGRAVKANLPEQDAGQARDKVGAAFKVSGRAVQDAKTVSNKAAPEVKKAVEVGRLPVSVAAAITDLPHEEQIALVRKGRKAVVKEAKHRTTQKRKANQAARAATAAKKVELPKGQYHCIVIDPPWQMEKIERDERPEQTGFDYPTMTEAELRALPVQRLAFKNCHLYLWTTHKHFPLAMALVEAWGFTYECLMTWVKNVGFTPFSWMRSTEHVLFCRRGKLDLQKVGMRLDFSGKVREHSRKPDVFYDLVREASPGPRLDYFSRQEHDGFEGWGNEKDKFQRDSA